LKACDIYCTNSPRNKLPKGLTDLLTDCLTKNNTSTPEIMEDCLQHVSVAKVRHPAEG